MKVYIDDARSLLDEIDQGELGLEVYLLVFSIHARRGSNLDCEGVPTYLNWTHWEEKGAVNQFYLGLSHRKYNVWSSVTSQVIKNRGLKKWWNIREKWTKIVGLRLVTMRKNNCYDVGINRSWVSAYLVFKLRTNMFNNYSIIIKKIWCFAHNTKWSSQAIVSVWRCWLVIDRGG